MEIPLLGANRSGSNTDYRDNLPVNYTIVVREVKGDQGYLISHDGLTELANDVGIDRGGIWNSRQQNHLRVSGNNLISVDESGVTADLGIITGSGQCSLPYSFQTQGILSGNKFWLYNGDTLEPQPYSAFPNFAPIDAVWINGIYVFTDRENIYHTEANDEKAIQGSSFGTNEFAPDGTLGLLADSQNQLVVFDRYSTSWFRDNGGDNFRFSRVQGRFSRVGIVGTHCKVELDGQIFLLGNRKDESPSIHILTGSSETNVATREIDIILEGYTEDELSQAVLETRTRKRQKILIVRLLRDTLEYHFDVAKKFGNHLAWTIIKSDVQGNAIWRGRNGVFDPRTSKWVYGDAIEGKLGYLDDTSNLQYGEKAEEICYTPLVNLESKSINNFELDTLPGFQTNDISVLLSMSFDGVVFGQETPVEYSSHGDYNQQFAGFALGYVRHNFSIKLRSVNDGKTVFSGLRIEHD